MKRHVDIKEFVREKYSRIARSSESKKPAQGCCSPSSCCPEVDYTVFSERYDQLEGYAPEADLGLGCGLPTEFAGIRAGDHVLDLGSGAGNDCFVARAIVGETGQVTGIDFSEDMLEKARQNALKLGYSNVEFIRGDIENILLPDHSFDVVVSNCVLNLVPDKTKAFAEIIRVLKPGGHFCISDVVLKGELPAKLKKDAEMYAGCVSGALPVEEYLDLIAQAGFKDVTVHKQKSIQIPEEILKHYLKGEELKTYLAKDSGLFSITVSGKKAF
jgi:ubiquinone/menaquinone biosynthesis C-methylase UbiE